jgi:Spy/CpxP family protein refolding chaperone
MLDLKKMFLLIILALIVIEVQAQTQGNNQNYNTNYGQQGQNNYTNQGQNGPATTPQDKAQRTANHLQKKLGLSPDQASQIYNLTLAHEQAKIDYDNACNNVLTPAQQQTWAQLKADEQARKDANRQQNGNNQGAINNSGNGNPPPQNNNNNNSNLDYNGGNR